ncbi:MAG: M20/M25/M40 family metallo-hydrolase [bacterium]
MKTFCKTVIYFSVLSFVLSFVSVAQIPPGYENGLKIITAKKMESYVHFLASDSLKGRATDMPEHLVAARYIAAMFREAGLKPLFAERRRSAAVDSAIDEDSPKLTDANDSYFQKFSLKRSKFAENRVRLNLDLGKAKISNTYAPGQDFIIQDKSGKSVSFTAPIVCAGYGVEKGEAGYNDYIAADGKEIDVRNKIVLVIDGFPRELDSTSVWVKARNAAYRNPLRKAEVAQAKGALAMIVVGSVLKKEPPIDIKYQTLATSFNRDFVYLPERPSTDIPILYISKNAKDDLYQNSGMTLDSLQGILESFLKGMAFEFQNKTLSVEINFISQMLPTQNVVGWIEGTDPVLKKEFLVYGAHYDHVGLGHYGSLNKKFEGQIHNGADDNASGTAGLMEIARAMKANPPKRSVVFIAFTAEEHGMLGSRYYVNEQPLKPIEGTVAMLNLDMISRNEEQLLAIGGAFYGDDIRLIAERANAEIGFSLLYNVGLYTNASDQAPFLRKKIPAAFFFAGDHDDYHTPADDVEKCNFTKAAKATKLAYLSGWIIANEERKPAFRDLPLDERKKLIDLSRERTEKVKGKKPVPSPKK